MNTAVLSAVRQRGYWRVVVRPTGYVGDRLASLRDLEEALRASVVQIRGWDYPHWPREEPARLADSIDASIDWEDHKEYWRAYKSGQFIHYFAAREDWLRENEGIRKIDVEPKTVLGFEMTVYTVVEVFLFASRWAAKAGLGPEVRIELSMIELAPRRLRAFDVRRDSFDGQQAQAGRFDHAQNYEPDELIAHATDRAIPVLRRLFELFHWDTTDDILKDHVDKALRRAL